MTDTKDKKLKLFFEIVILLSVFSFLFSFYRYMFDGDFRIYAHVSCDPREEQCFAYPCEEDTPECEPEPYKAIIKKAKSILPCDAKAGLCGEISCYPTEEECEVVYCSEDNLANYETASACFSHE